MRDLKSVVSTGVMPLHVYLRYRMRQLPDLTNAEVARALGYPRPNVVAMIMSGTMPLPLAKVPALARVLRIDPLALLRRAMSSYMPEEWQTIETVIGETKLLSSNEMALLQKFREVLAGEDVALLDDAQFSSEISELLIAALNRHVQTLLAARPTDKPARPTTAAGLSDSMVDLLRQQAIERTALARRHAASRAAARGEEVLPRTKKPSGQPRDYDAGEHGSYRAESR